MKLLALLLCVTVAQATVFVYSGEYRVQAVAEWLRYNITLSKTEINTILFPNDVPFEGPCVPLINSTYPIMFEAGAIEIRPVDYNYNTVFNCTGTVDAQLVLLGGYYQTVKIINLTLINYTFPVIETISSPINYTNIITLSNVELIDPIINDQPLIKLAYAIQVEIDMKLKDINLSTVIEVISASVAHPNDVSIHGTFENVSITSFCNGCYSTLELSNLQLSNVVVQYYASPANVYLVIDHCVFDTVNFTLPGAVNATILNSEILHYRGPCLANVTESYFDMYNVVLDDVVMDTLVAKDTREIVINMTNVTVTNFNLTSMLCNNSGCFVTIKDSYMATVQIPSIMNSDGSVLLQNVALTNVNSSYFVCVSSAGVVAQLHNVTLQNWPAGSALMTEYSSSFTLLDINGLVITDSRMRYLASLSSSLNRGSAFVRNVYVANSSFASKVFGMLGVFPDFYQDDLYVRFVNITCVNITIGSHFIRLDNVPYSAIDNVTLTNINATIGRALIVIDDGRDAQLSRVRIENVYTDGGMVDIGSRSMTLSNINVLNVYNYTAHGPDLKLFSIAGATVNIHTVQVNNQVSHGNCTLFYVTDVREYISIVPVDVHGMFDIKNVNVQGSSVNEILRYHSSYSENVTLNLSKLVMNGLTPLKSVFSRDGPSRTNLFVNLDAVDVSVSNITSFLHIINQTNAIVTMNNVNIPPQIGADRSGFILFADNVAVSNVTVTNVVMTSPNATSSSLFYSTGRINLVLGNVTSHHSVCHYPPVNCYNDVNTTYVSSNFTVISIGNNDMPHMIQPVTVPVTTAPSKIYKTGYTADVIVTMDVSILPPYSTLQCGLGDLEGSMFTPATLVDDHVVCHGLMPANVTESMLYLFVCTKPAIWCSVSSVLSVNSTVFTVTGTDPVRNIVPEFRIVVDEVPPAPYMCVLQNTTFGGFTVPGQLNDSVIFCNFSSIELPVANYTVMLASGSHTVSGVSSFWYKKVTIAAASPTIMSIPGLVKLTDNSWQFLPRYCGISNVTSMTPDVIGYETLPVIDDDYSIWCNITDTYKLGVSYKLWIFDGTEYVTNHSISVLALARPQVLAVTPNEYFVNEATTVSVITTMITADAYAWFHGQVNAVPDNGIGNYTVQHLNFSIVVACKYSTFTKCDAVIPTSNLPRSLTVHLSHNGVQWDDAASAGVAFKYEYRQCLASVLVNASAISYNRRKLDVQPSLHLTVPGITVVDTVVVTTSPLATSISGGSVDTVDGYANFTSLQIVGVPNTVYTVCYTSLKNLFTSICVPLTIASCNDITPHSTQVGNVCQCQNGYQPTLSGDCEACPLNTYKNLIGQAGCDACPKDSFTNGTASTSLSSCLCMSHLGFTNHTFGNGSWSCLCDAGYSYVNSRCEKCSLGMYKDSVSNGACDQCHASMTTLTTGSISYTDCVCRSYLTTSNGSQCLCNPGYYEYSEGVCEPCGIGYYKSALSNSRCSACHPTMTTLQSGSTNASSCVCKSDLMLQYSQDNITKCECKPGYDYDYVKDLCLGCQYGSFKPYTGNSACTKCLPSRTTASIASTVDTQCVCAHGYYQFVNVTNNNNKPCLACPAGATCAGGSSQPQAGRGYYKSTDSDSVFIKCQAINACDGDDACSEGYEGYLCGECSTGFYRRGHDCLKCDAWADILLYVAVLAVVIFVVSLYVASYMPSKSTKFAALRIGWSFVQVTSLYAQFELNWPKEIKAVFNYLSLVNLDIQIASPECSLGGQLSYFVLFVVKMLMPVVFIVLLALCWIITKVFKSRTAESNKSVEWTSNPTNVIVLEAVKHENAALIRSALLMLMLFYIPMCNFTLSYFNCTHQPDGSYSLDAQPSVACYAGAHLNYLPLSLYGIIVYMIGVPVLIMYILQHNKQDLYSDTCYSRFGFLVSRFKPGSYYWEVVLLMRLMLLTITLTLLDSSVPIQTMAGTTVLFIATLLQEEHKPFLTNHLNTLEICALVCSVLTLLAGQVFYNAEQGSFIITVLTIIVLLILIMNMLVVGFVVYLDWSPVDDGHKFFEFASEVAEQFDSVAVVVTDHSSVSMSSGDGSRAVTVVDGQETNCTAALGLDEEL